MRAARKKEISVEAQEVLVRAETRGRGEYKRFLDADAQRRRVQHGFTVVFDFIFLA